MTGIQSRDESVGDSSDDEPLSKMVKPGKKSSDLQPSDIVEDVSPKETLKDPTSTADAAGELSDSEDEQPLTVIIKKKKKQKSDTEEPEDAKKTKSSKKRKTVAKASKVRESTPSPSSSPVKVTQRRGRKGTDDMKKKASARSPAVNMAAKRRSRLQKEAPSSDYSDDEPSSRLVKKSELEMKQAVVVLVRMSERDVTDAVARGRTRSPEQKSTDRAESAAESSDDEPLSHKMKRLKGQSKAARGRKPVADASSDDEPLVRKVKSAKVKDKFRKRANGEEDAVKQDKELSEEDERPH